MQRTGAICKRESLVLFHEFFIQKVQVHFKTVFPPPLCLDQQPLISYIIQQLPERSIADAANLLQLGSRYSVLRKQCCPNEKNVELCIFSFSLSGKVPTSFSYRPNRIFRLCNPSTSSCMAFKSISNIINRNGVKSPRLRGSLQTRNAS